MRVVRLEADNIWQVKPGCYTSDPFIGLIKSSMKIIQSLVKLVDNTHIRKEKYGSIIGNFMTD